MKKTKPRGVTPGWVMYLALVIGVWRRGDARVRVQAGRCRLMFAIFFTIGATRLEQLLRIFDL